MASRPMSRCSVAKACAAASRTDGSSSQRAARTVAMRSARCASTDSRPAELMSSERPRQTPCHFREGGGVPY
eukprot:3617108-Prymnesium_polylepis.1